LQLPQPAGRVGRWGWCVVRCGAREAGVQVTANPQPTNTPSLLPACLPACLLT
jgi:hypothetical protein